MAFSSLCSALAVDRAFKTCGAVLLLIFVFSCSGSPSRAGEAARRVLLLNAFGHAFSPWSDMAGSFRAELIKKSPEQIDLYEVSLDTARVLDSRDEGPFVDYIHALLSERKPDLIVPIGAPAAFFVQRNRARLFPMTPMLVVGAEPRSEGMNTRATENVAMKVLHYAAFPLFGHVSNLCEYGSD